MLDIAEATRLVRQCLEDNDLEVIMIDKPIIYYEGIEYQMHTCRCSLDWYEDISEAVSSREDTLDGKIFLMSAEFIRLDDELFMTYRSNI